MQRRLIVMRHAKSSWKSGAATDHARPLNARGRRDAPAIGQRLRDSGWVPQMVLSSDSKRTRETYRRMSEQLGDVVPARFLRSLYDAGLDGFRAEVAAMPRDVTAALVRGKRSSGGSAARTSC